MIELVIKKRLQSTDGTMTLILNEVINKGDFVALYGPSGAGKTSTLQLLAGLMKPDEGSIKVNDKYWYKNSKSLPLQDRNIAYMFQDYALFPNMTVRENIQFASKENSSTPLVSNLIKEMQLDELADKLPNSLSGGQQQRVALARAMAQEPDILLLDEPLSALDTQTRLSLQNHLAEFHRSMGLTTIMISHDISEIVKLADKVLKLEKGKVIESGSPEEVFMQKELSGKFKFTGEVINIKQQGFLCIVTVLIQNNQIKVIAQKTEIEDLDIGEKVVVASKAFNPIIYKLNK
jgi:molybdate transport system ATP-binding protein